jgi:hypothetical protein
MTIYRRVYEAHYGPIPVDEQGRTYDIHHIDGDKTNNYPSNLIALSIQEHYNIHHAQGDWGACLAIMIRMSKSPEEISKISKQNAKALVERGQHHFLGGKIARRSNQRRLTAGTHHLVGGSLQRKLVAEGRHNFQSKKHRTIAKNTQKRLLAEGSHNFILSNHKRLKEGKHNFTQEHICPHCGRLGKGPQMFRYHFDNCRKIHNELG